MSPLPLNSEFSCNAGAWRRAVWTLMTAGNSMSLSAAMYCALVATCATALHLKERNVHEVK